MIVLVWGWACIMLARWLFSMISVSILLIYLESSYSIAHHPYLLSPGPVLVGRSRPGAPIELNIYK